MIFHQAIGVDGNFMLFAVLFKIIEKMDVVSAIFKDDLFGITAQDQMIIPSLTDFSRCYRHDFLLYERYIST